MPLRLPDGLPAIERLKKENIFVMNDTRAHSQDIRPLKIAVLNLMPLKITTETDLVRILSNTPLQLDVTFMKLKSHTPKNTPIEHMQMFYLDFDVLRESKFDGMIITGAPLEMMEFEDVSYWNEIRDIMTWARTHVTSTLYICWAAQAGLYLHYGIEKIQLQTKKFGIFPTQCLKPLDPIFRGFDDWFMMPHSRHTAVVEKNIPLLEPLAGSDDTGVSIYKGRDGREFYVTGHLEYAPDTLDKEYKRDIGKRDDVEQPLNYYDTNGNIKVTWRSAANLFFQNWINYYVYQPTPFDITEIN